MSRKFFAAMVLCTLVAGSADEARGQGYALGYMDIGPTIGLGGLGEASLAFGGRFEKAIKALPDLGDGIVGIQAGAEYYSWSSNLGTFGDYSVSWLSIGVTANYHFVLENKKIDPFLGLGLGYQIVSCDLEDQFGDDACGGSSALYFVGRAGGRYFFAERMALYADVGAGAATLNVGLMFKLR